MFAKMAVTLMESGQFDVTVIGYPTISKPDFKGVDVISLPAFKRLSLQRVMARWRTFKEIWKMRPEVLIVTTHELLLHALLVKVLLNTVIVYDVQENYYRNIVHSRSFPGIISWPLALLVRLKEKLLAPSIDHFLLAERGYEKEFKFHRAGWTVIENKALETSERLPSESRGLNLLFSGTLSESTGVFRAINIAKELHQIDAGVTLTIVGKSSIKSERERIQQEASKCDFITVTGGENLVPHSEILAAIRSADFGILSYPLSDHTRNSHPTKLFEYLNGQLPIILGDQWPWTEQYLKYRPFVFIDFENPDYHRLLNDLKSNDFYTSAPENVTWASEKEAFLQAIRNL